MTALPAMLKIDSYVLREHTKNTSKLRIAWTLAHLRGLLGSDMVKRESVFFRAAHHDGRRAYNVHAFLRLGLGKHRAHAHKHLDTLVLGASHVWEPEQGREERNRRRTSLNGWPSFLNSA
jgi:hypothetical protein